MHRLRTHRIGIEPRGQRRIGVIRMRRDESRRARRNPRAKLRRNKARPRQRRIELFGIFRIVEKRDVGRPRTIKRLQACKTTRRIGIRLKRDAGQCGDFAKRDRARRRKEKRIAHDRERQRAGDHPALDRQKEVPPEKRKYCVWSYCCFVIG